MNHFEEEFDDSIQIPKLLHSIDGPFKKCLVCNCDLDETPMYAIDRMFVGKEPILECAICVSCQLSLNNELSEESKQRITAHVEERVDFEQRSGLLMEQGKFTIDEWIDECILTGKKRSECRSYAIYGACCDNFLLLFQLPYMVSDEGFEQIQKLVSKSTRDRLQDFNDEYFGMPPEFSDLPFSLV